MREYQSDQEHHLTLTVALLDVFILHQVADLAVAPLTITYVREKVIDF